MKIAYLASKVTLPGSPMRRADAYEHDLMMAALTPALKKAGLEVQAIDWMAQDVRWEQFGAAIIGTTWDYWDHHEAFLKKLRDIEAKTRLFNASQLVAWNSAKTYLQDLEKRGAKIIPTLWLEHVQSDSAEAAFDHFQTDDLVFKRQIGAGAAGQVRLRRHDPVPEMPHPMMVQPFLPSIVSEGELSFIFIGGNFCHALMKRPKTGDYRIQSAYGGEEAVLHPMPADLHAAMEIIEMLDEPPLYARVDMIRDKEGALQLMELELIEPYLYPVQGPQLGAMFAGALTKEL